MLYTLDLLSSFSKELMPAKAKFFAMDVACKYWPYLEKSARVLPALQELTEMKPYLSIMHARAHASKCEIYAPATRPATDIHACHSTCHGYTHLSVDLPRINAPVSRPATDKRTCQSTCHRYMRLSLVLPRIYAPVTRPVCGHAIYA
ncbi:hypothetical protein DPX16_22942 [Anabarilius grahami]|uniref:Uncharacterized protein n=1 Tax=Anabarilius grahami TaxID=495550 RepID=A0A3N0Y611_ANAGA|nr:hypothetical protein DPX16_22942 [Anabarilius grahami]